MRNGVELTTDWLAGWLTEWLTGWLADQSTNQLVPGTQSHLRNRYFFFWRSKVKKFRHVRIPKFRLCLRRRTELLAWRKLLWHSKWIQLRSFCSMCVYLLHDQVTKPNIHAPMFIWTLCSRNTYERGGLTRQLVLQWEADSRLASYSGNRPPFIVRQVLLPLLLAMDRSLILG